MSILLVEDDPSTLFAYAQQLMRAGVEIIEAASGQEALDLLERGSVPACSWSIWDCRTSRAQT
jgi:CheY-like chemotaxis protein